MLILLDTEFTSLLEPELLSLGMVTASEPAEEFYVEVDLQSEAGRGLAGRSSDMVRESVLPQWGAIAGATATPREIGRRAGEWLLAMHERLLAAASKPERRLEVGFDYPTDYELLERAVRDARLWDRVQGILRPVLLAGIVTSMEAEIAAEGYFREQRSRGLQRHHALADALALRAGYRAVRARLLGAFGAADGEGNEEGRE